MVDPAAFMALPVDNSVKAVVVGTDFNLSMSKMAQASMFVNNGAELIGTNIDRNDGKERLRPSGGALTKLIEVACGLNTPSCFSKQLEPTIMGKPDAWCFDLLKR